MGGKPGFTSATAAGGFAREQFDSRMPRLERGTADTYQWVSELHEDYADSTVATIFA